MSEALTRVLKVSQNISKARVIIPKATGGWKAEAFGITTGLTRSHVGAEETTE